jgi:prepilin-type N-terminal cleavage/methylation domain-containing protein
VRRERGFSLLETLVALTILGLVLLMSMAMVLNHPRIVRRMDAERQAYRAIEATLEMLRADAMDLSSGPVEVYLPPGSPTQDLTVEVTVTPEPQPGLHRVVIEADYSVYGQKLSKRVETMLWELPEL